MKNIAVTILASLIFVVCISPFLVKLNIPRKYLLDAVIVILSVISIVVILFWGNLPTLLRRYINTKNLSKPYLVLPEYIFIFLSFSCLFIWILKRQYIPKTSLEFWCFLVISIILVISMILFLIVFLILCFLKGKENEKASATKDSSLLSDDAIHIAKQDLLGREGFVGDLYKEISCLAFNDSFVFGIHGKWGEGKSSIINLLLEKFEHDKGFIVVNYDPWHFNNEKSIMSAFYGEIERSINKEFIFPNLKKVFTKYQKIIWTGLSQAGIKINPFLYEESIGEVKKRIESYIEQIEKKLLIIIDDIDRLQPNEILLIFKLVRLNTKFENTIFLLSFDRILVQNILKVNSKVDPAFLDKIVQKPVPLPPIEQSKINEILYSYLNKLFDEINIAKDERLKFEEKFPYQLRTQINQLVKNLRHVKRYINGLRSTLPPIKTEVCLYDFCILEIIRIFYPKVYDDIWNNPWYYIPLDWSSGVEYFTSPFRLPDKDDVKYVQIEEHINKICNNEKDGIILKEFLTEIFFIEVKKALNKGRSGYSKDYADSERAEKRITHPDSFKKYFMLKVSSSEMSDGFVEATLDSWRLTEKNKKEYIIKSKMYEIQKEGELTKFFEKLKIFIDKVNIETATEIIRAIYKDAERISKESGGHHSGKDDYESALYLLMHLINNKIERDKIQEMLEEVVITTSYVKLSVDVVDCCNAKQNLLYFIVYY